MMAGRARRPCVLRLSARDGSGRTGLASHGIAMPELKEAGRLLSHASDGAIVKTGRVK
jgi:hypothetical protein